MGSSYRCMHCEKYVPEGAPHNCAALWVDDGPRMVALESYGGREMLVAPGAVVAIFSDDDFSLEPPDIADTCEVVLATGRMFSAKGRPSEVAAKLGVRL